MGSKDKKKSKFTATVVEVEQLTPNVRRLRLDASEIGQLVWAAGDKVKLRVGDKTKASYTPARVDHDGGWMDVVVHLHGRGPFARWAARSRVGEWVKVKGPKSSLRGPQGNEQWGVLLGDATTLGLACALADAMPEGIHLRGAIEMTAHDAPAVQALGLSP